MEAENWLLYGHAPCAVLADHYPSTMRGTTTGRLLGGLVDRGVMDKALEQQKTLRASMRVGTEEIGWALLEQEWYGGVLERQTLTQITPQLDFAALEKRVLAFSGFNSYWAMPQITPAHWYEAFEPANLPNDVVARRPQPQHAFVEKIYAGDARQIDPHAAPQPWSGGERAARHSSGPLRDRWGRGRS